MSGRGWIGVDLDGTLAHYDGWKGIEHIGEPIPLMVERVKRWLAEGRAVKIFTARVIRENGSMSSEAVGYIWKWCEEHLGQRLHVTNQKDMGMQELWDDRAVCVERNTGEVLGCNV